MSGILYWRKFSDRIYRMNIYFFQEFPPRLVKEVNKDALKKEHTKIDTLKPVDFSKDLEVSLKIKFPLKWLVDWIFRLIQNFKVTWNVNGVWQQEERIIYFRMHNLMTDFKVFALRAKMYFIELENHFTPLLWIIAKENMRKLTLKYLVLHGIHERRE